MKGTKEIKKDLVKEYYKKDECFNHECVSCGSNLREESYNGWSNYETWACNLWITNDSGSYGYWTDKADEIFKDSKAEYYKDSNGKKRLSFSKYERAFLDLADVLKDEIEESIPDIEGLASDLLWANVKAINWVEVAKSLYDDDKETDKQRLEENKESDQYKIKNQMKYSKRPQRSGL